MNNVDAAFAQAKKAQTPSAEYQLEVVNEAFEIVKNKLRESRDIPEFAKFNSVEEAREVLKDDTITDTHVDRWIELLDDSVNACCLGHRVETLSDMGRQMLMTSVMCESSGCEDEDTHKFLRYFAAAVGEAVNFLATRLLPPKN